jgi:superfamily II DNA helicase RecQ
VLWYVATRDEAAAAAALCRACGLLAVDYNAELPDGERRQIEAAWVSGRLGAVCATRDSFGLGIDKANVPLVILAEGGGLHAWLQQLGRAGRNGQLALVATLAAPLDRAPPAPMVRPFTRRR